MFSFVCLSVSESLLRPKGIVPTPQKDNKTKYEPFYTCSTRKHDLQLMDGELRIFEKYVECCQHKRAPSGPFVIHRIFTILESEWPSSYQDFICSIDDTAVRKEIEKTW